MTPQARADRDRVSRVWRFAVRRWQIAKTHLVLAHVGNDMAAVKVAVDRDYRWFDMCDRCSRLYHIAVHMPQPNVDASGTGFWR